MTEPTACRVGVAQRPFTPPLGSELCGYFHKRFAKAVRSELYAKALVIESGGRRMALVANDIAYILPSVAEPVRARLAAECGLAPESILIASTHTHTGPAFNKMPGNPVDPIPGYPEVIVDAIVRAVQEACASLFDATLHAGLADAPGFTRNKLCRLKNGRDLYDMRPLGQPNDERIGYAGPLDTSVQVLGVYDAEERVRALAVNFAGHPNSGGDEIWAEWPGEMARTLAAVYGADVPCLFLQGTGGDVDCAAARPRVWRGIAGAAMLALEQAATPLPAAPLDVRLRQLVIPRLQKTPETDRIMEAFRNKPNLNYLEKAWPLRYDAYNPEPAERIVPVQCFRLGELALAALPGEAFTALGLEIKRYSPAARTWVVAYANDSVGYIPPVEQANRGGYGEWPFMTRHLVPEAATMMTDAAIAMLHEMW